jgi:hypothetical protein
MSENTNTANVNERAFSAMLAAGMELIRQRGQGGPVEVEKLTEVNKLGTRSFTSLMDVHHPDRRPDGEDSP